MAGRKGGRRRKRRRKSRRLRFGPRRVLLTMGGALVLAALYLGLLLPFWQLASQFSDRPLQQPSRLYGRPPLLEVDEVFSPERLVAELESQGYRAATAEPGPGEYRASSSWPPSLDVELRSFLTPHGRSHPARLRVEFAGRFVRRLEMNGTSVPSVWLEPTLLASYYGSDLQERRPWRLEQVPEHLVRAVLAAEDASFFTHPGLSWRGIVRATWNNVRGGELRQGGSTLTQQLVKNLFLTHERSAVRKLREVPLALILELRYSKEEILLAYLNEIYWGQSGPVSLMGAGAAAWVYFGKDASQLTLPESALLAGMIQSPNGYSPVAHPERAKQRRDWVLGRMAHLGWLDAAAHEAALAAPIDLQLQPIDLQFARYAAAALAAEAQDRYGIRDLADRGYTLFASLGYEDQKAAEESVGWGLERLETGWQKDAASSAPLQGALLSVDPRSGAILAYVGGRDFRSSQFDRLRLARRQPGSSFKTFVYLSAFADRIASPATLLEDSPLTLSNGRQSWTPHNDDGEFRGWVTARRALEESLNVPTARLAHIVGYKRIVEWARALGISSRLQPVPSLALGAFEVTPNELLTAYATLAAGGRRPELHGLQVAFDSDERMLVGRAVAAPQPVVAPEVAFVTNTMLQGVLDRGTGKRVRQDGLHDALAGKTGTTNDRRDSWFVGYSPDRATLVWVGYDDGAATRLSGARAALPIWSRFTYARRPALGYPTFEQPPGVVSVAIDPASGERATGRCPEVLTEVFLFDQVPQLDCRLHGGRRRWRDEGSGDDRRRWLERIFGTRRRSRPPT